MFTAPFQNCFPAPYSILLFAAPFRSTVSKNVIERACVGFFFLISRDYVCFSSRTHWAFGRLNFRVSDKGVRGR